MFSQFFILSPRGDVILSRDYLGNTPKVTVTAEQFFRKFSFWDGGGRDAPPVFNHSSVNYIYVKESGVILVLTTRENVSPVTATELLKRIASIIKDYCGYLSEEVVKKNFILLYEVIDEVIDFGYPQNTSSDILKDYVVNEPILVKSSKASKLARTGRAPELMKGSVLKTQRTGSKDEIFVDIIEKMSCTFNPSGYLQQSQIDGSIQVKSFLSGNPAISLHLIDDLRINRREGGAAASSYGGVSSSEVVLDDCNFHESVNLESFDINRSLDLIPPEGETALMNYRTTSDFRPPFKVTAVVEADPDSALKAVVSIKIRAEFGADKATGELEVVVPMPDEVLRVSCSYDRPLKPADAQSWDWQEKAHRLVWKFKKGFPQGNAEHTLKVRATLDEPFGSRMQHSVGPINLQFYIPNYCASRLKVKYLTIHKDEKNYAPLRWVRYVTQSNSYVVRV